MRPRPFTIAVLVGAFAGFLFSAVSTYDFARHVDRQVHDLHCSFVPGLSGAAAESGCQVAMLSPYSSIWRSWVWGGIPISLAAMAVFAFLLFYAFELMVTRRQDDRRAAGFLALATVLPAAASVVMAFISLTELDAVCKLCAGVYGASALCLIGGVGLWVQARKGAPAAAAPRRAREPRRAPGPVEDEHQRPDPAFAGGPRAPSEPPAPEAPPRIERAATRPSVGWGYLAAAFGVGVFFVGVSVLGYVAAMPDHGRFVGTCGQLDDTEGDGVLVPLGDQSGAPVIEVLDPLCPACGAFEKRLEASGLGDDIARKVLLFPLDSECNWMLDEPAHAGACAVSHAVLCADDRAQEVLDWAFAEQKAIKEALKSGEQTGWDIVTERFPELASCIGSAPVKAKLTQSMHWAARHSLPLTTPQVFVDGVKLCEEDVDLGLDFALSRMIEAHRAGTLRAPVEGAVAAEGVEAELESETETETNGDEEAVEEAVEPVEEPGEETSEEAVAEVQTEGSGAGAGTDSDSETDSETETDSEAEAETDSETEAGTEAGAESAAGVEPEVEVEPEAEAEGGSEATGETEATDDEGGSP